MPIPGSLGDPIRFGEAWHGIRALMKNPRDTPEVFKIIRAKPGKANARQFQKFLRPEHGPRILSEKRSLVDRLSDREWLASRLEGSLGPIYADFTERESITPEGLVDASESVEAGQHDGEELSGERVLSGDRLRDGHDLWHMLTSYCRDLVGEAALLTLTYRQMRNRGMGFIVLVAYLKAGKTCPEERVMIRDGFRRSKKSEWLPGADRKVLLECPLIEVQQIPGVVPVDSYSDLRSDGAPAIA